MMGGIGQMIFGMIFNFMLMMLFAPKPKDTVNYGPRLDNLKPAVKDIQGQVINLTYGTTRISGTVFWASDIRETVHTDVTEHSSKGGSSYTHTEVTYTYDCDLAVGICEGPIVGIRKIWANKDLIYNIDAQPNYVSWLKWRIYYGTDFQNPDPILEANFGGPITPAHRGLAYIVFEQFQLDPFGRRVPQSIEFEVVAKGVISGQAYKYPQLEYDDWQDYGDDETIPDINVMLLLDTNTLVFPVLNESANNYAGDQGIPVRWAKLNIASSTITKYAIPSGTNWNGNSIGYGTWVSGLSIGGWHRHVGGYAWLPLNWGQGYRHTPCYIQCCSYDISQNDYAYYQVFNIINGRMVGHGYLNGGYVGSFNDFYYHGIGLGSLWTGQYSNANETLYEHDILEVTKQGINTDPTGYDEFGFSKTILNLSRGLNKEATFPVNRCYSEDEKNNLRFYFVGWPETYEEEYPEDQLDDINKIDKIVYRRTYDITQQGLWTGDRRDIILFENCTYNVMDMLERGLAYKVRVSTTTVKTTYYAYKPPSESTTFKEYYYQAEAGPVVSLYDADPDPPQQVPPYDKNIDLYTKRSIFVHYVTNAVETSNYSPTFWIRFTNGSELVCINSKIYKKPAFSGYDFPRTYLDWLTRYGDTTDDTSYFSWNIYSSINLSIGNRRETIPNNHFPEYDRQYKLNVPSFESKTTPTGYTILYIPNDSTKFGYNTAPFTYIKNAWLPRTSYYQPGAKKIYYPSGTSIYSYEINSDTAILEVSAPAERGFHQVIPYAGDFIALYGNTNSGYGAMDANLFYVQRKVLSKNALLGEIIEDITLKAGISLDTLDISDKAYNVEVGGYNISDDIKLIDALETLLIHYFIDAYESEWKIKFRTRKEAISNITTLNDEELGIKSLGENRNEKYRITLREDTQLPQSVSYTYISSENGYSQANVIAIRNVDFNLGIKSSIKAPIALLTNEAYSNAFRILFDMWRTTKEYEFRLPKKYSYLEPGDVVLLPINAADLTNEYLVIKISEIVSEGGKFLELKGVEEDARDTEAILQTNGAYETTVNTLLPPSATNLTLLDSRPLYNKFTNIDYSEAGSGVYVGAHSDSKYWQGGSLFSSFDNQTYIRNLDFEPPGGVGGLLYSITNTRVDPHYLDTVNSIQVQTESNEDFFAPTIEDFYYLESGLLAIVSNKTNHVEYIQFQNVDIIDDSNPKLVKFTNLQRGLYNSYNYNAQFSFQDRVFYLPKSTKKLNVSTEYYNKIIYTKGVSFGQAIDNVAGYPSTYKCNWFLPNPIGNSTYSYDGTNINISWIQTERIKPGYLLFTPTQIDPLEYKVSVYKGSTLLREDTSTNNSYTYTSANMILDGVNFLDLLTFTIQRKAIFLDYNHSVIDSINYIPLDYTTDVILSNKYPSITSNLYVDFTEQNSTILATNNSNYTVTYNNYNGRGKLDVTPGYYSTAARILKYGDILYYYNITGTYNWTVYFIMKLNGTVFSGQQYILSGSYMPYISGYPQNQISYNNTYCGNYMNYTLATDVWYFVAFSAGSTNGRVKRMYIRSMLDPNVKYQNSTPTGCNGGDGYLNSSGPIFDGILAKGNILQEMGIINLDLYQAEGNSYAGYDSLYNIGRERWLKR